MSRFLLIPIIRFSPLIQSLKRSIPSAHFFKKLFIVLALAFVQLFVSVFSLPAYVFVGRTKYAAITKRPQEAVIQYHFRRVVLLVLLFLIAFWAGIRFFADSLFLYNNSAEHTAVTIQNFSSTLTTNYNPVTNVKVDVPNGRGGITVSGEAPAHQKVLVVFDEGTVFMAAAVSDANKQWSIDIGPGELSILPGVHALRCFLISDDTILTPSRQTPYRFSIPPDPRTGLWRQTAAVPVFIITLLAIILTVILVSKLHLLSSSQKA